MKPFFEADEAMKAVGGVGYLAQLTGSGAGLIGARDFAQQIYDLALLRQLIGVGRELVESAMDTSEDVNPLGQIESAEMALYKVAEGGGDTVGSVKTFLQASRTALALADRAQKSGGHLSGCTTGLSGLNAKIGGMHNSDLMILAGRPGMGKTSLATNIAYNAASRWLRDDRAGIEPAKNMGAKTAFFSLEMSADQLATRVLAEQSGISSEALRMGRISGDQFQQLSRAATELQELPLFIDDTPGLTIAALRSRARRLKRRHDIGFVVIDYLQLLQGSSKSGDNRVQEISEISRGLKTLAKELQIPIIALSQLSRAVETRKESKMPQLSDLRESGAIEQDADMVMFIYRPEYYEIGANEMGESTKGETHIRIAKHRNGSLDTVKLRAQLEIQKFHDWDEGGLGGMMGGGNWKPVGPAPAPGGGAAPESGGGKFFVQGSKMNSNNFDEGFEGDAPF